MYVGALLPALILIGAYCLYVFAVTLIRPRWAPALPLETRTLGHGVTSLIVILSVAITIHFAAYNTVFSDMRYEVRFVWSATTATLFAYVFALANRFFKIGILSRLAEQVVIVLIPPLALIFLVLGTIFLGIATPTGVALIATLPPARGHHEYTMIRLCLGGTVPKYPKR